jgi:hypothetical protein
VPRCAAVCLPWQLAGGASDGGKQVTESEWQVRCWRLGVGRRTTFRKPPTRFVLLCLAGVAADRTDLTGREEEARGVSWIQAIFVAGARPAWTDGCAAKDDHSPSDGRCGRCDRSPTIWWRTRRRARPLASARSRLRRASFSSNHSSSLEASFALMSVRVHRF